MDVVVVGASLGGLRVAEALRAIGSDDRVVLVGDEEHLPYDRPPLSKEILTGKLDRDDIALRDTAGLAELGVELQLGRRAVALDTRDRVVELDGGTALGFDEIVVATGARARRLPALDGVEGVHVLRTIEHALAIREAMEQGARVAVVGGGFIGSEVASAARDRGLDTTVLEALDAPLCRVLGPVLGVRLGRLHADWGSDLRCRAEVAGVDGARRVERVRLGDGAGVDADLVVVGVGSVPNTEWLAGSGLDTTDGVLCDSRGRAVGAEHVHAVGDVARWVSRRFGDAVRTEHWTAAGDQAQSVAADLLGQPEPAEPVPYVWSDQFGLRIQVAGRFRADDHIEVVRDDDAFVAMAGRDGRLAAVVAMDDPRRFGGFRRLLARDATWDDALGEARKSGGGDQWGG